MGGSLQGPGAPPENSLAAASHSRHTLGPQAAWVRVSSPCRSGPESPLSSHSQPLHPRDGVWGPVLPKRVTAQMYLGAGSHGQHHPETHRNLKGCSPRPDCEKHSEGRLRWADARTDYRPSPSPPGSDSQALQHTAAQGIQTRTGPQTPGQAAGQATGTQDLEAEERLGGLIRCKCSQLGRKPQRASGRHGDINHWKL